MPRDRKRASKTKIARSGKRSRRLEQLDRGMANKVTPQPSSGGVVRLEVMRKPGESDQAAHARSALSPAVRHLALVHAVEGRLSPPLDINACVRSFEASVAAVQAGDLGSVEEMLYAQVASLDSIYGEMMRRAMSQLHLPDIADKYMRLAFRAQSQARAAIETLAEIKNPRPVAFINTRQANVANGPQQVNNNGAQPARQLESAREESAFPANKVLEARPV